MASLLTASVLAVKFKKCVHMNEKRLMISIPHRTMCLDVFKTHHDGPRIKDTDFQARAATKPAEDMFDVSPTLTIGDLVDLGVKYMEFDCVIESAQSPETTEVDNSRQAEPVDAFQILMARKVGDVKCKYV